VDRPEPIQPQMDGIAVDHDDPVAVDACRSRRGRRNGHAAGEARVGHPLVERDRCGRRLDDDRAGLRVCGRRAKGDPDGTGIHDPGRLGGDR
jgi:hypothetical protein